MAILLFILFIIPLIYGIRECCDDAVCFSCLVAIPCLVVVAWSSFDLIASRDVDARISMYEEQNAKIESQVSEVVDRYMNHEDKTFSNAKSNSSITLVSLYPELKSDKLMVKLINTYTKNNDKITELKEEKIKAQRARWWLYFGK